MISDAEKETILYTLKEEIKDLSMVYIFGSSVTNQENKESDIDIAFYAEEKIDNILRWDIANKLALKLKKDIDLVDMSSCSDVMKMQIVSKGESIFNIDKTDFEERLFYRYIDLCELRSSIIEDVKSSGAIYG